MWPLNSPIAALAAHSSAVVPEELSFAMQNCNQEQNVLTFCKILRFS